jgi:hypothetical protein
LFTVYQIGSLVLGFWTWNLVGQGVLFLFAGNNRERNGIYRLLRAFNFPVIWIARKVSFGFIPDFHLGFLALFLVVIGRMLWYSFCYSQGWIPDVTGVGPLPW